MLEEGAVLKIHHMVVYVFSGRPDGRMFNGEWFIVVEAGLGDTIRPIDTRKGEDINWWEEDDKGVMELRKWLKERMMVNRSKISNTEDIVYWFETDLSCRMVTASRSEDGLVVRVEHGTPSHRRRMGTISTSYKFG